MSSEYSLKGVNRTPNYHIAAHCAYDPPPINRILLNLPLHLLAVGIRGSKIGYSCDSELRRVEQTMNYLQFYELMSVVDMSPHRGRVGVFCKAMKI